MDYIQNGRPDDPDEKPRRQMFVDALLPSTYKLFALEKAAKTPEQRIALATCTYFLQFVGEE